MATYQCRIQHNFSPLFLVGVFEMKVLQMLVRKLLRVCWIFCEKIQNAILRSQKNALGAPELKKKRTSNIGENVRRG